MKKIYLQPFMSEIVLKNHIRLMVESGLEDDPVTPGVGGGSGSRLYRDFDEDEEDEEF